MTAAAPLVGIQIGPVSFLDEGIEGVLDVLQRRVGVNVVMLGTISWLGLKIGRRISHALEGWPDHGARDPAPLGGGAYFRPRPEFFARTAIRDFATRDPGFAGADILEAVLPAAKARGLRVMAEFMEPLFRYEGHGATDESGVPGLAACSEIDLDGTASGEPCTSHPDYRLWWHAIIEQHARCYPIDGVMWCNERRSPLDCMMQGRAPGCFCAHCRREAAARGIDVDDVRTAFAAAWTFFGAARAGERFVDGTLIEFLRVLLRHPEVLLWERFWLERNKDLDRELHAIVKAARAELEFGLNVWNRNHFNPVRKAQWSWAEQVAYADWVKPIVYQHQAGRIFAAEMDHFARTLLAEFTAEEFVPAMYRILGLDEAPWSDVVRRGMDPDSYVAGQCADAVRGVGGRIPVYMGIGVDAPRTRADQAACTPEIVRRSVHATFRAGGAGVVFAPSYAGMNLATLDGGARALAELGFGAGS